MERLAFEPEAAPAGYGHHQHHQTCERCRAAGEELRREREAFLTARPARPFLAARIAGEYRDLFGEGRYWLELQDHGLEAQQKVNEGVARLARDLGIGLVATNDCHYLLPDDHFAHDVLVCIQTGKTVHSDDRIRHSPQHNLKSAAEMTDLFAWAPYAVANTLAVAERYQFAFEKQRYHLPDFPVPPGYDLEGFFERVVRDGFEQRRAHWRAERDAGRLRHDPEAYTERLERESMEP